MSFRDYEVFQVFCKKCFKKVEARTIEEAIRILAEHENDPKHDEKRKKECNKVG